MESISSREARDHLAEVLNKVAYGGEKYLLTRHGSGIAVLISLEEWKLIETILESLEDQEDIRDANAAMKRAKKEGTISHKALKKRLGL